MPDLPDLLTPEGWHGLTYEPFRDGIEIHHLWNGPPNVALLRYSPGAVAPRHRHDGLETILVLEGSQSDERGTYGAGSLLFNADGTEHSVWSEEGCVVLIQWERPVIFLAQDSAA